MRYSQEDKQRAVELAAQSNARKASDELGISYQTVLNWVKAAKEKQPTDNPETTAAVDMPSNDQQESYEGPARTAEYKPVPENEISPEEQIRALLKENDALARENIRLKSAIVTLVS